jgi:hypothetical protein
MEPAGMMQIFRFFSDFSSKMLLSLPEESPSNKPFQQSVGHHFLSFELLEHIFIS